MPISVKISIIGNPQLPIKPVLIESDASTIADLQQKIAEQLGIEAADITNTEITLNQAKKMAVGHRPQLTLQDLNISDGMSLSVAIATSKTINPVVSNTQPSLLAQKSFLEEQRVSTLRTAQHGLRTALKNAEDTQAHVIITVGSYMNKVHDEVSLERQQFPLDRLGRLNENERVNLIHIDPQFGKKDDTVLQWHQQEGWVLVDTNAHNTVSTYAKDNYLITTIAQEIVNDEEGEAYFNAKGYVESILDVDLKPFLEEASRQGRGFITGNFYDAAAEPVIQIAPAPEEEAVTDQSANANPSG